MKRTIKSARALWRRRTVTRGLPERDVSPASTLVVAPHPDDETFGAGGLIALKRAANTEVHVLFLTDGGASLKSHCEIPVAEVAQARRDQSTRACGCLGLQPANLLRLGWADGEIPDGGQPGFDQMAAEVARIVLRLSPAEVYCPHPADGFPDHDAASRIVQAALHGIDTRCRLAYYPVWLWFNFRGPLAQAVSSQTAWNLDIRPVHDQKLAAIAQYLDAPPAPGGHPYCGYLPRGVVLPARSQSEIYFNGEQGDGRNKSGRKMWEQNGKK